MTTKPEVSFEPCGTIASGQDGAISGGYIFRLDSRGCCRVAKLDPLEPVTEFALDGLAVMTPHSNAVCFGQCYAPDDEFPLLYTNVYNTYRKETDKREGVCCVYRISRDGDSFSSKLLQIIRIGFTDTRGLWRSQNTEDVRPYGNFIVDAVHQRLYAFTMLDEEKKTRFFAFRLPQVESGADYPHTVTLGEEDILFRFDSEYTQYMQGAAFHEGKIISVEGFSGSAVNKPRLRVFDVEQKRQILEVDLTDHGLMIEPEMVESYQGELYYSDIHGNFFKVRMEAP